MKEEILIKAGRFLMKFYTHTLLNMQIIKSGDLPNGAKLFAGNHPTTTDPFFLSLITDEPIRILVTANVFEIPVFRSYLRGCGHIPVHRVKGTGNEAIRRAVEYLQEGKNVGIFPEGDLSPESGQGYRVLPARYGVARIALQSGKPVIPVGISLEKHGIKSREFQFSNRDTTSRWVTRGAYEITVGSPMTFEGDPDDRVVVAEVANQITTEIRKLTLLSQNRLPQFNVNWNAMLSYRKIISTRGG